MRGAKEGADRDTTAWGLVAFGCLGAFDLQETRAGASRWSGPGHAADAREIESGFHEMWDGCGARNVEILKSSRFPRGFWKISMKSSNEILESLKLWIASTVLREY